MTLDQATDKAIAVEGGYVNDPSDSGGETNWGITVAVARANGYTGPMRAMSREQAKGIYKHAYAVRPGIDRIFSINSDLGYEVFDSGINCGQATAIKWLQIALNSLNRQGTDYPDLVEDGKYGNGTESALKKYIQLRKLEGISVLLKALNILQGAHYINLSRARQKDEKYVYGWISNRIILPYRG